MYIYIYIRSLYIETILQYVTCNKLTHCHLLHHRNDQINNQIKPDHAYLRLPESAFLTRYLSAIHYTNLLPLTSHYGSHQLAQILEHHSIRPV